MPATVGVTGERSVKGIDAVLILGKELRVDAERAERELRARAAAAAVALREGARFAATLEAPLRGQAQAGSEIVEMFLDELGVPVASRLLGAHTRSTREEARAASRLVADHQLRRLGVITHHYHLRRTRRYLGRVLSPTRFAVFTPECFLQRASPRERAWIRAATLDAETLRRETRVEWGVGLLLAPLLWVPGGEAIEIAVVGRFRQANAGGGGTSAR